MTNLTLSVTYQGVKYLTPSGARELLSVPKSTLYHWCLRNEIETAPPEVSQFLKDVGVIQGETLVTEESLKRKIRQSYLR